MRFNRHHSRNYMIQGMQQPMMPQQQPYGFYPPQPMDLGMGQPLYQGGFYPGNSSPSGGLYGQPHGYYGEQGSHFLFQNPLEAGGGDVQAPQTGFNPYFPMNPYPKNNLQPKQPGAMSVLNSFKSQDGSLDITKMVNTAGQAINAVSQATALLKGLGGVFKA
ncbi:YppG family protein [Neobacillus sp. SCS-31]|uniref:YppG family protein n=1 Tax=Neobacillus oceani TaxID=3115292 RepID=UPI003905BC4C